MRYLNNYRYRGVYAYENRQAKALEGNYEDRLVEIIAKFSSSCRETRNKIAAGERILWLPGSSVVFCQDSTHWSRFKARQRSVRSSHSGNDPQNSKP